MDKELYCMTICIILSINFIVFSECLYISVLVDFANIICKKISRWQLFSFPVGI